ncbi:sensory neuron membrane protein 1-like isoform X1 [Pseudomyrmex gracilis]|uniref:sensory neuron membrane protein 1-like isoform X1 n=3 Tax=Pseudomyrmex gracilis TaxID=219809 RepID=UPI0009956C93|nr:sensory neuron membrane protein 1-like isoform X1 [Pseudomyrmex gracilis]
MVDFRKCFAEQSENNVARRVLRRINTTIRNPNVRRLLSFFTIGRILDVVLLINDNHKVLTKHIMVSIKRLGLAGSCTFSIGLISYSIGFPAMLKSQVKSQVRLKKGEEIRGFWEKLPQPLDFNIYVFNVTNPKEITAGAKPIVQEVGPFHYDLYRDKENLVDRDEDDTVEYSLRQVWYFNSAKSSASENAEIYAFHPVMLAVTLLTQIEKPAALGVVSKALDSVFKKPDSMFIKTTVKELFFDGVRFSCVDIKDFAGSALCGVLQEKSDTFILEGDSRYRYGYFSKTNGTQVPKSIRVYRGIKNSKDVGRMYSLGNATKMDTWPGSPCNDLHGTDGTIFPPFLTKNKEVWAHFPDICRSIGAYYVEPGKVQGFKTLHYTADLGDPSENKNVRCLCLEPEGCMPKNIYNAGPCLRVPIRISLPHLLNSDPHYYEMIEGLNPDPEKHQMTFDFDAMTGTPIRAYKKIQFNALVGPIPKMKLMKNFPDALFPIFWIEDGLELGDVLIKPLKTAYTQILIAKTIMWLMMLGGIGMMIAAAVRYHKENAGNVTLNVVPKTAKKDSATSPHKLPAISTVQGALPNID